MLPRITKHITRLWGHRKNVADSSNPGQTKSVQVYEVKITERTLANLKAALADAESRIEAVRAAHGSERLADLDETQPDRHFPLPDETQTAISKALPRLQIWPSEREGECQLKVFAFEVRGMEPAETASNEDNSSQKTPQLPEDNEGGFAGLGSLFG